MMDRLEEIKARYLQIQGEVSDPAIIREQQRYRKLMRESNDLREIVEEYDRFLKVEEDLLAARQMLKDGADGDMLELVNEEIGALEEQQETLSERLKLLLIPKDPREGKNIIMEIRAGTGGDESALFVADLYRMYARYSESRRWKLDLLSSHATEIGGFKEIILSVSGRQVYGELRYESGVHRVQRVPATEAGGRIHTSAVTVAVLPEAEETDIDIKAEDMRIDVYRSSGPGGQSVNTTDSAVRITHLPTGMVVTCQDEKSQHKNKAKALRVLRARLLEKEEEKKQAERAEERRSQIGSGDRSERIRTYNYPQNRITDHRINLTLYRLDSFIEGDLQDLIEELKLNARQRYFKAADL
jgi:peptide chain release factor 1